MPNGKAEFSIAITMIIKKKSFLITSKNHSNILKFSELFD